MTTVGKKTHLSLFKRVQEDELNVSSETFDCPSSLWSLSKHAWSQWVKLRAKYHLAADRRWVWKHVYTLLFALHLLRVAEHSLSFKRLGSKEFIQICIKAGKGSAVTGSCGLKAQITPLWFSSGQHLFHPRPLWKTLIEASLHNKCTVSK